MTIYRRDLLNAFAAIILAALASIAFHAFCTAALADSPTPPQLPSGDQLGISAPAEILGLYQVAAVSRINRSGVSQTCPTTAASAGPTDSDFRCGKYVWIVRSNNQVAILKSGSSEDDPGGRIHSAIFDGGACDTSISLADAQAKLFSSSRLCRAFLIQSRAGSSTERFLFNESLNPDGPNAMARSIGGSYGQTGGIIGIKSASDFTLELPAGERSPKQVRITEAISGTETIALIPLNVSWQNILTLTYVGM